MHMLHALLWRALLRRRRAHPLDDPLESPEWAGLWRVFAWRARIECWRRQRRGRRPAAHRPARIRQGSAG